MDGDTRTVDGDAVVAPHTPHENPPGWSSSQPQGGGLAAPELAWDDHDALPLSFGVQLNNPPNTFVEGVQPELQQGQKTMIKASPATTILALIVFIGGFLFYICLELQPAVKDKIMHKKQDALAGGRLSLRAAVAGIIDAEDWRVEEQEG